MAKKISEKLIIGNAFIYSGKSSLTKQQIYHFWHIVDKMLPNGYYTYGNNNSISDFCEEYSFLVKRVSDMILVNCEDGLLERYCRIGIPVEIRKIFDDAGTKLNAIETDKNIQKKLIKK